MGQNLLLTLSDPVTCEQVWKETMQIQCECSLSSTVTNPVASGMSESRYKLYHYLIDIPQNQPALALGKLEGGRSPYAVAGTRDENELSTDRLSLHGNKKLHKSL